MSATVVVGSHGHVRFRTSAPTGNVRVVRNGHVRRVPLRRPLTRSFDLKRVS